MFPSSEIQFAPAGADRTLGLKAGIAAADFEPLPDAPTAVSRTSETAAAKARNCTSLFTPSLLLRIEQYVFLCSRFDSRRLGDRRPKSISTVPTGQDRTDGRVYFLVRLHELPMRSSLDQVERQIPIA